MIGPPIATYIPNAELQNDPKPMKPEGTKSLQAHAGLTQVRSRLDATSEHVGASSVS